MRDVIFVLSLIAAFVGPMLWSDFRGPLFILGVTVATYWAYRWCNIRVRIPRPVLLLTRRISEDYWRWN